MIWLLAIWYMWFIINIKLCQMQSKRFQHLEYQSLRSCYFDIIFLKLTACGFFNIVILCLTTWFWSWSKQSIEQLFHRFINNFLFEQLINQISYTKKLIKKSSALGKAELVKSDAFKHRILKKMLWDRMLNKYLLGAIMWTKSPNVKSIK